MFIWNIYFIRNLRFLCFCLYGFYYFTLVLSYSFSEQPIFRQFTVTNISQELKNSVDKILKPNFPNEYNLFHWTTVTGFKEIINNTRVVWLIFGGSIDRVNVSSVNPFAKKAVGVIACRLTYNSEYSLWLHLDECSPMEVKNISDQENEQVPKHHEGTTLLGVSLGSLEFEKPISGVVIVYCDPLWHTGERKYRSQSVLDMKYQEQAGGRCHIRLRHNGKWLRQRKTNQTEDIIRFCTNSGYSQPCGGGFSFDLQQTTSIDSYQNYYDHLNPQLPNIRLLTSLFLANPGEVHILDDILMNFKNIPDQQQAKFSVHRILGSQVQFSQQVRWTPLSKSWKHYLNSEDNNSILGGDVWMHENLAIVSSLGNYYEPNIKAFNSKSTEPEGLLAYSITNKNRSNAEPSSDFTGFGFTVETVNIPQHSKGKSVSRTTYGILIGAPFESSTKQYNPNHGRVYIVCPEKRITHKTGLFSVEGTRKNEFFGYSIARLGDIDGDGIDDVAISAPAIQSKKMELPNENLNIPLHSGRVYIYRVTSQCTLDPQPLQIIESPKPEIGDSFGIGLSRGFDADGDGWPEFAVTSLKLNTVPYLFTMPKLLKSQCRVNIPPLYSMLHFRKGTTIPFEMNVRLYDLHLRQYINIPAGLISTKIRHHEVNPDVLWNDYLYSNSTTQTFSSDMLMKQRVELSTFDMFTMQLHKLTPRFQLADNKISNIRLDSSQSYIVIKFHLTAMYGLEEMNLNSVPLKISYKSGLNLTECNFMQNLDKCNKQEHPLIDWSECSQLIQLAQPVCIPANECSSDLSFMNISWSPIHSLMTTQSYKNSLTEVNNSFIKILKYGHPNEQQQVIQLKLINLGPTKSTGLSILTRFHNWYLVDNENLTLTDSIQGKITMINIKKLSKNETSSINLINSTDAKIWTINIHENGLLTLISLSPYLWIYPNEIIQIDIYVFIQGLLSLSTLSTGQKLKNDLMPFSYLSMNYRYPPKFEIQVKSETNDKQKENNLESIPYRILFKPMVNIFAGIQPSTIIDDRLEPYMIEQNPISRKIFSYDIGPRIEHTFLIENQGWIALTNLSLILQLPYETTSGHRLLYLTDQVREASYTNQTTLLRNTLPTIIGSDGKQYGTCEIPKKFINPLELTLMDFKFINEKTRKAANNSIVRLTKRIKRDIEEFNKSSMSYSQNIQNFIPDLTPDLHNNNNILQRTFKNRIILNCPHLTTSTKSIKTTENHYFIKCINIQCHIKHFKHGDTVRLKWTGWLWSETFFKLKKSDIQFISRLNIDNWGELPLIIKTYHDIEKNLFENKSYTMNTDDKFIDIKYPSDNYFELKQSIIFHGVQLKMTHKVPLWPVIAGIVVGLWILMILSALLYCCGFFTRRRIYSTLKTRNISFFHQNNHYNERNHDNNLNSKFFDWTSSQGSFIKTENNHRLLTSSNSTPPMSIQNNHFEFDDSEETCKSNMNDKLLSDEHFEKNTLHITNNECQQNLFKKFVEPNENNENDECFSPLLRQPKVLLSEQHQSQQLEVIEEDKESSKSSVSLNNNFEL